MAHHCRIWCGEVDKHHTLWLLELVSGDVAVPLGVPVLTRDFPDPQSWNRLENQQLERKKQAQLRAQFDDDVSLPIPPPASHVIYHVTFHIVMVDL
jgi:hypothetical protein